MIKIDLTPELLAVLPAEHCKAILLQLITTEKNPETKQQVKKTNIRYGDDFINAVVAHYNTGATIRELADHYNVDYKLVWHWVNRRKKKL